MKKLIFSISMIILFSKIIGFVRDLILSFYFGASDITDAFFVSTSIPVLVFNFIGLGITSSFIPIYSDIKENYGEETSYNFSSNVLGVLFIICTVVCIVILLLTNDIVKILAHGFSGQLLERTVFYTRISMITLFLSVMISILSSILQVHDKFYMVALSGIPYNLIYIFGIYISSKIGDMYLIFTVVVATLIQLLFILYPTVRIGYIPKLYFNFKDNFMNKLLMLSFPIIMSTGLEQINYLIDRTIASSLQQIGGITILTYATRINIAVIGILVASIISVLFPKISICIAKKNYTDLKTIIEITIFIIILFGLPLSILLSFYSKEIIYILFRRGQFTTTDVELTAKCFKYYSICLFIFGIRELLLKIFYALKEKKIIFYNSLIGVILNIILSIYLSKVVGLSGIALATSICLIITTIYLCIKLNTFSFFNIKILVHILVKCLLSAIIMVCFLRFFEYFFYFEWIILKLIIGSILGICIYLIGLVLMKVPFKEKLRIK